MRAPFVSFVLAICGLMASVHGQAPPGAATFLAYATEHAGNATAGPALFTRMACSQCHSTDGSANRAGPDLSAVGSKFSKVELIRAVMEPSANVAVGYDQTIITRKDGSVAAGVIKQATADWIELMGADGKAVRVMTTDIATRDTVGVSLMPENLYASGTPAEFADLIAYLGTLRQSAGGSATEEIPKASKPVKLDSFFDDAITFDEPTWFGEIPGCENAYVVLEHHGKSWIVTKNPNGDTRETLLDLTAEVRAGGATGLLSIAFHPKFPADLRYFLKYQIVEQGKISTLLMERKFSKDLKVDSGEASRMLLKIPSTTQDHNGGCIAFGPDGYLYLGMGDTGPQRDPQGHAQDMGLLLGKLLRIDIDHMDDGLSYAIPKDNPFVHVEGARPEIWALGFREPWRFSWDRETGDLWLGDVGQDRFEEVEIVRKGENHGWNVIEGFTPFSERYRRNGAELVAPIWSYPHRIGDSVTGGYVYRGSRAPALRGWYIFADHDSRRIWALTQKDRKVGKVIEIGMAPTRAVSLSQDHDGELYLVGFNSGKIYHLALDAVDLTSAKTQILAATAENGPVPWHFTLTHPAEEWTSIDTDVSTWPEAPAGFGSANTPGTMTRTPWTTQDVWLRREFKLEMALDPSSQIALRIHHDEDAEVFLNGERIANLPRWTQGYENIPLSTSALQALKVGSNVLAIHCHQNTGGQYIDAGLLLEDGASVRNSQ